MVTLVKHGVNAAPIKSIACDDDYRMQYMALQLAQARVLVRHRHAPADRPAHRLALNNALRDSPAGDLVIDIGDFNECPSDCAGAQVVFPDSNTFRRNTNSNDYITKIDGALISDRLASAGAKATTISTRATTQHKPVLINLDIPVCIHECYRVVTPPPENMGAWAAESIGSFNDAIQNGTIDDAWSIWLAAAGASVPHVQRSQPWGGFNCGESAQRVSSLFKRRRQLLARANAADDARAEALLDEISHIINDASTQRLATWKQRVFSRGGAAKWIKDKLAYLADRPLQTYSTAVFGANQVAHKLADELATRWNVGVYKFDRTGNPTTAFTNGQRPDLQQLTPPPPLRQREPLDLTLFDNIPALPDYERWSAESILQFLPKGAAGLDGQSVEWLHHLHSDSLDRLALLFDAADDGHLPWHWRVAKVALIPKPDSDERRPLTILSATYRLWTKRRARVLNNWMDSWAPEGLSGALPNHCCTDVLWEVLGTLSDAQGGHGSPQFVLSLDQRQCFDRLFLETFEEIDAKLNLNLKAIIDNYRHIIRFLSVDGEATEIVLCGPSTCGIPQGCPIATVLANLAAVAWHVTCLRVAPVQPNAYYSYLDDRLSISSSWGVMQKILDATKLLDASFGPELNMSKSRRGVACNNPRSPLAREPSDGTLLTIQRVSNFKYLGVDVVLNKTRGAIIQPTADKRISAHQARCSFIKMAPTRQRAALVSDATSSLWLAGTTALTTSHISTAVTASFLALAGNRPKGAVQLRSRNIGHLVGPAPHLTHPACALVYTWMRCLWRAMITGKLTLLVWSSRWARRNHAINGPCFQPIAAFKTLRIVWTSPFQISCLGRCLDFEPPADFLARQLPARDAFSKQPPRKLFHDLRAFLQDCLASVEATRRPKDFHDLVNGIDRRIEVREHTHAMLLCFGGPSLLTGGIWTRYKAQFVALDGIVSCPRCGEPCETLHHRLWQCPLNATAYDHLVAQLSTPGVLNNLPTCLRRCGLAPSGCNIAVADVCAVQTYLVTVNEHATLYNAARSDIGIVAGKAIPVAVTTSDRRRPIQDIYDAALPPLKRRKKQGHAVRPIDDTNNANADPVRPMQDHGVRFPFPTPQPTPINHGNDLHLVYVDGSAMQVQESDVAGWGFCLISTQFTDIVDCCGPVVTSTASTAYCGARQATNNVGELQAMLLALRVIYALDLTGTVTICYDSEVAASLIQRKFRANANFRLVINARNAYDKVTACCPINWQHVYSHTGDIFNNRADALAKYGAFSGITRISCPQIRGLLELE